MRPISTNLERQPITGPICIPSFILIVWRASILLARNRYEEVTRLHLQEALYACMLCCILLFRLVLLHYFQMFVSFWFRKEGRLLGQSQMKMEGHRKSNIFHLNPWSPRTFLNAKGTGYSKLDLVLMVLMVLILSQTLVALIGHWLRSESTLHVHIYWKLFHQTYFNYFQFWKRSMRPHDDIIHSFIIIERIGWAKSFNDGGINIVPIMLHISNIC